MSATPAGTPEPICPHCGTGNPVPVVYGFPAPEAVAAFERGDIALGGCCLDPSAPRWHCRTCHQRYGKLLADSPATS